MPLTLDCSSGCIEWANDANMEGTLPFVFYRS